jgi:hypothetical protein
MRKTLLCAALLAISLPLAAQDWSLGVGTGPFIFGDFVERRLRPVNTEGPDIPITLTLSAATRPGLTVNLERSFAERWALRAEGTFTHAPLSIKQSDGSAFQFDSGTLDVATVALPLVFRINPKGTFRFHIMGGPAYAMYKKTAPAHTPTIALDDRTVNTWGFTYGGGVGWWFSERFAVEGNLSDIVTPSPFKEADSSFTPGVTVKRPHNVHTTVGVRWRF